MTVLWWVVQRDATKLAGIERWVYTINGVALLCGLGLSLLFTLHDSMGNYRDLYCMIKPGFYLHASYITVSGAARVESIGLYTAQEACLCMRARGPY
jgi:hypothetical protein